MNKQVVALIGPTGTGKSALADALAARLNGEVVSADSMQVYQGMDIGTAKTPPAERSVPYHCLDLVAPGEPFNASCYQRAARAAIDDILARGKLPVVCGGTGLYVRAALDAFDLGAQDAPNTPGAHGAPATLNAPGVSATSAIPNTPAQTLRKNLEAEAAALGAEAFYAKLAAADPASAALIHPHNVRRVVRAFEWLEEGSSYAAQAQGFNRYQEFYATRYVGLDLPREELYPRLNERVERMIEAGLLNEVRALLAAGYEQALTAQQAIGYKELVPVLRGSIELACAIEEIKQATRNYAKRQKSWFRRDPRIEWLSAHDTTAILKSWS